MVKALTQEIRGVEQGALLIASMRLRRIHPGATLTIAGKEVDPGTYAREQMALSDAEVKAIAEPLADMGLPRLPPWVILALVSAMIVAPRVETYNEIEGALRASMKAQEPTE